MNQLKKQAFTLVELIVVITILAILATISFISIQGFTKDARDGTRLADINSIEKALELFKLETGYYPEPSGSTAITYSGAEVWTQGTVGDSVRTNLKRLSEKPVDPLTLNEYTYSRLNTKNEYELAMILEGDLSYESNILKQTNANGTKIATTKVVGNYNQMLAKVNTGSTDYVLAVPTIIASDIGDATLLSMLANYKFAYNGFKNLPASYTGTSFNMNGEGNLLVTNLGESNIVVFSGSLSDLKTNDTAGENARELLVSNLQRSYTGTAITGNTQISELLSQDTATSTSYNNTIINNNIGAFIVIENGETCDDGNPNTINDIYINSLCIGKNTTTPICNDSSLNLDANNSTCSGIKITTYNATNNINGYTVSGNSLTNGWGVERSGNNFRLRYRGNHSSYITLSSDGKTLSSSTEVAGRATNNPTLGLQKLSNGFRFYYRANNSPNGIYTYGATITVNSSGLISGTSKSSANNYGFIRQANGYFKPDFGYTPKPPSIKFIPYGNNYTCPNGGTLSGTICSLTENITDDPVKCGDVGYHLEINICVEN